MYIIGLADRHIIFGISSEIKSVESPEGSVFKEVDTGKEFMLESSIWVEKLNNSYLAGVHNHDPSYSPIGHTHLASPPADPTYAVLASGATAMGLATNNTVKVTPTANATYTTTVPPAGTRCAIMILTSGTTSRTITFGSGFKPVGTLATGTVSARVFIINFISDGTNLYEAGRTAAIVA